tara:strand:- start:4647 stop:5822 length:1176 start_codon:yes stop_codon:yes gene_type:complete
MNADWQKHRLKDVIEFPPKVKLTKGIKYPFIPMENLDSGMKYAKPSFKKALTGGGAKFEEGDTLFARITPCLENGKIAQAKDLGNLPGFGSTEYFIFRGKKDVSDSDFVYYLSKTHFLRQSAINSMVGASGRQRADAGFIRNLIIALPPLPTQRKIASILTVYDDLIENNLKRIKLLEEKAQLMYEEWFVRMRFPGHEEVKINEESGLPEGWEKVYLKDLAEFKYGKMPKKNKVKEFGNPIFSGYRITGYYEDAMFENPTLIIVARGVGGTGDIKLTPRNCWLTNLSIAILPNKKAKQNYLYYLLKDSNLRSLDSGAAQSQITITSLASIQIIIGPLKYQEKFNTLVSVMFELIENLTCQNQLLKEARDILLPRLMTGMIDVEKMKIPALS